MGYDWAFLGACNRAEDAALMAGDPGSSAYESAYEASLLAEGYEFLSSTAAQR
jgi:hypothetical protein